MRPSTERLAAKGNQGTKARVAEVQAEPEDGAEINGDQDVGEERVADADVRTDSAAEVAGKQDRSEDRGLRNGVEDHAAKQDDADCEDDRRWEAEFGGSFDDNREVQELHDGI